MTMIGNLERIRELTQKIRIKQHEYRGMLPALAPVRLDGMPRAAGEVEAMDALVDARTEMLERIQRMIDELLTIECEVKPFVDALPEHLHTFAMCYYYDGHDIENVTVIMGKGKSTLYKYKDDIRKLGEKFD